MGNKFTGKSRNPDQTFFPDIKFKFQEFESKDALHDYLKHPSLGLESHPGVCFAFNMNEKGKNDYELELHFNDGIITDWRSVPEQALESAPSY